MDTKTEVTSGEFYTPCDVGRQVNRSAATIKRMADELRLPLKRTVGGVRIFNADQVQRLKDEIVRREMEAMR
jgi:hypothetical protein